MPALRLRRSGKGLTPQRRPEIPLQTLRQHFQLIHEHGARFFKEGHRSVAEVLRVHN